MQQAPITPATITLHDGKERVLRFSNGALKAIKKQFGVSVLREGPGKLFTTVDEDQLSKLLVLGLDHKSEGGQPGITEAEIDEILDAQNAAVACQQVFTALGNSTLKNALDVVNLWVENAKKAAADKLEAEKPKAPEPSPELTSSEPTTVM